MQLIETIAEMKAWSRAARVSGATIGFVPTMGYLHEGHLSLMRQVQAQTDKLVVSIFVNPTQFGPNEDLAKYPRDLPHDTELCASVGVDAIFLPTPAMMYPDGYHTYVNVENLTNGLCGAARPGHFRGVTTVVLKLFNIVDPDVAAFGRKDYQQLQVLKRMVVDLNLDLKILEGPTVREADGLAMSSRNKYLTAEQRGHALVLSKSLERARELYRSGVRDPQEIVAAVKEMISATPQCQVDYIELVDAQHLSAIGMIVKPAVLALAVKVGNTRLIDNAVLGEDECR